MLLASVAVAPADGRRTSPRSSSAPRSTCCRTAGRSSSASVPARRSSPSPRRPTSARRRIPKGQTGMAHMFEHMAFKGTPVIGTTDYEKEKPALEAMEAAYQAWQRARDARKPDPKELEQLQKAFEDEAGRRAAVRQAERVRRADRARRRRRPERRHQLRRDHLLLLAARQQVRAVRLSRVRALLAAGVPRVLQGARRRHRRAAHADREPADRPPGREVPSARRSPRTRTATRRSAIASDLAALHDDRREGRSSTSTTARRTW